MLHTGDEIGSRNLPAIGTGANFRRRLRGRQAQHLNRAVQRCDTDQHIGLRGGESIEPDAFPRNIVRASHLNGGYQRGRHPLATRPAILPTAVWQ